MSGDELDQIGSIDKDINGGHDTERLEHQISLSKPKLQESSFE